VLGAALTIGYRVSRCTDGRNAPQHWWWAVVDGDPKRVWRELVAAVRPNVHPNAMPDVVGDIRAVLERVEACQAVDPDDVKNISRNRDLWEVRFQLETWNLVIRIYETEVGHLPEHMVALLAHEKVTDVADDEIADMQNAQIDEATARWVKGQPLNWGIP